MQNAFDGHRGNTAWLKCLPLPFLEFTQMFESQGPPVAEHRLFFPLPAGLLFMTTTCAAQRHPQMG